MENNPKYYVLSSAGGAIYSSVRVAREYKYGYESMNCFERSSNRRPPPVPFALETDDPVNKPPKLKAIYEDAGKVLFRDDLIKAILAAGVDNIKFFDAIITEPLTGAVYKNYKVVNIYGLVDLADKEKSKYMGIGDEIFPDAFAEAHFDGSKGDGTLICHLSGGMSPIMVHERVRRYIERFKVPDITYTSSGEWMG